MNYMGKIAEMLGVEMGERFDIKYASNKTKDCYFTETGLCDKNDATITYRGLTNILNGRAEIVRKPFRPQFGGKYWYVSYDGEIENVDADGETFDLMAVCMNNCFRTKAEAEAHKDEIIQKFEVIGDDR